MRDRKISSVKHTQRLFNWSEPPGLRELNLVVVVVVDDDDDDDVVGVSCNPVLELSDEHFC